MRLILCLQARRKAIEHFDVPLIGDCRRRPISLLEPKGADDALGTECTPRRDLLAVKWLLHHDIGTFSCPDSTVFGVHAAVKFKMRFIAKPDVPRKVESDSHFCEDHLAKLARCSLSAVVS